MLQAQLKQRRDAGELVGAGIAMFVEKSGLGPFDGVRITVDSNGLVEVVTGAASVGQGVETVIAQICADTLGVDYARVSVIHGQTDRIEKGLGAFASRVTVMTGEATRLAAKNFAKKPYRCGIDADVGRQTRHRRWRGGSDERAAASRWRWPRSPLH